MSRVANGVTPGGERSTQIKGISDAASTYSISLFEIGVADALATRQCDAMDSLERATIAGKIGFWALAADIQRDRVLDRAAGAFTNQLDATLLAFAIRNVVRAAKWAKGVVPARAEAALSAFDVRVPNATDVRDLLEHFDEYERGKGKLQKSGVVRNYNIFYSRVEDEYLLHLADGFELNVQSSVHAVHELADAIQEALIGQSGRPAI